MNPMYHKTILVVEDEPLTAMSYRILLQELGSRVYILDSGVKAVELALRTDQIDLIVMDINLGSGMNGVEAATQILKHKKLPVIFISAMEHSQVFQDLQDVEHAAFVSKNGSDEDLLAIIKQVLSQEHG